MREYETVFVIRPDGAESQTNQLLEKVNALIGQHEGTVLQNVNMGRRDLAYAIGKYKQGNYFYYNFAGDTKLVADIERTLKLNDLSIRYLTVKLNDKIDVEARRKELASAAAAAEVKEVPPAEEGKVEPSGTSSEAKEAGTENKEVSDA